MLDLSTLKEALAPLSKMGRDEFVFEATDGMQVTLRPLLPLEEVAIQRFSASVLDDIQAQEGLDNNDNMSRAAAMDYFDRFRIEIIANSIVQVNDLDLRDVKYVATGETLENGTPVQVSRGIAMRGIVQGWSRAMITVCFARYGDLVQKIADIADKIAKTTLPDLDAEISRVEKRLADLKEDRATRAKGDPSVTAQQITNLVEAGKALEAEADRAFEHVEEEAMARQAVQNRKKSAQQQAPEAPPEAPEAPPEAPPEASPEAPPPEAEAEASPAPQREPVIPPASPPPSSFSASPGTHVPGEVMSSFGDGDDPEVLAAEELRIMEARRHAALARHTAEQETRDPMRDAVKVGDVGGVETYRLPKEEVSPRGRSPQPVKKGEAQEAPPSTENPNFKPSR
jgi:hypothetical protein